MVKTMTFNELRKIKDSLPDGTIRKIAQQLNITEETVRNYFGGHDFDKGKAVVGVHIEPGPDGGVVTLDDTTILDLAMQEMARV
ncbi:MAG TPA: DNA-binding protein [Paludibacteraceae bacterium]|nr:DNA-binding protein [Paludibacteraceae bacterium]HOH74387.1 DNA-binding protein [Paludibacteraceae bacterium]HOR40721.1 DNA-binding protein [Paludibacteraceae bacterium]HOU27567.1 DNA-binding protein [Paludibacteraceae bacterium]HPL94373.1 DNA-binding protein [Paludibacteraceae bacterium]